MKITITLDEDKFLGHIQERLKEWHGIEVTTMELKSNPKLADWVSIFATDCYSGQIEDSLSYFEHGDDMAEVMGYESK